MDILDDMGVSKLSAKVFFKVNYSFKSHSENWPMWIQTRFHTLCRVTKDALLHLTNATGINFTLQ